MKKKVLRAMKEASKKVPGSTYRSVKKFFKQPENRKELNKLVRP